MEVKISLIHLLIVLPIDDTATWGHFSVHHLIIPPTKKMQNADHELGCIFGSRNRVKNVKSCQQRTNHIKYVFNCLSQTLKMIREITTMGCYVCLQSDLNFHISLHKVKNEDMLLKVYANIHYGMLLAGWPSDCHLLNVKNMFYTSTLTTR